MVRFRTHALRQNPLIESFYAGPWVPSGFSVECLRRDVQGRSMAETNLAHAELRLCNL